MPLLWHFNTIHVSKYVKLMVINNHFEFKDATLLK